MAPIRMATEATASWLPSLAPGRALVPGLVEPASTPGAPGLPALPLAPGLAEPASTRELPGQPELPEPGRPVLAEPEQPEPEQPLVLSRMGWLDPDR